MTIAELWDTITEAGSNTGGAIRRGANNLRRYDREDFLSAIGLEPKRSTVEIVLPAVGFFAVGVLAGVGLGMLFAPKPGYELREDLSEQMKGAVKKSPEMAGQTPGTDTVSPVI